MHLPSAFRGGVPVRRQDHRGFTLIELLVAKLAPVAAEMKRLSADPGHIDAVLGDGAARAQAMAAETMKAVKDIVGLVRR